MFQFGSLVAVLSRKGFKESRGQCLVQKVHQQVCILLFQNTKLAGIEPSLFICAKWPWTCTSLQLLSQTIDHELKEHLAFTTGCIDRHVTGTASVCLSLSGYIHGQIRSTLRHGAHSLSGRDKQMCLLWVMHSLQEPWHTTPNAWHATPSYRIINWRIDLRVVRHEGRISNHECVLGQSSCIWA